MDLEGKMLSYKNYLSEAISLVKLTIDPDVNSKTECKIIAEIGNSEFPRQIKKEPVLYTMSNDYGPGTYSARIELPAIGRNYSLRLVQYPARVAHFFHITGSGFMKPGSNNPNTMMEKIISQPDNFKQLCQEFKNTNFFAAVDYILIGPCNEDQLNPVMFNTLLKECELDIFKEFDFPRRKDSLRIIVLKRKMVPYQTWLKEVIPTASSSMAKTARNEKTKSTSLDSFLQHIQNTIDSNEMEK